MGAEKVEALTFHAAATEESHASYWTSFEDQEEKTVRLTEFLRMTLQIGLSVPADLGQSRLIAEVVGDIENIGGRVVFANQLTLYAGEGDVETLKLTPLVRYHYQTRVTVPRYHCRDLLSKNRKTCKLAFLINPHSLFSLELP